MENLKIILRGIAEGHKTIFRNENGDYISKQVDSFQTHTLHEGFEEKDIENMLMFELYGEFPLDEKDQIDYEKNIKPAFKLT
jgi:hypothetical protein